MAGKFERIEWKEAVPGDEIYEWLASNKGVEYTGPYTVLDTQSRLLIHPEGYMFVFFGDCIFRRL